MNNQRQKKKNRREKKGSIVELRWSSAVFLCSSVSSNGPREEKWRREELVGGHSHLPGVVFLPFIWTGIGIQFQLSVLHLLKHTEMHVYTHIHITHTHHPVRWKEQRMLELHRNPPEALWVQLCGTVASGKGLHTDYNTHTHTHTQPIHTVRDSKCARARAHKYTRTYILPQMWNSGLREGIT